ncbi:hypothetical protein V8B97DRAFT_1970642 [Scleroderma yunnanense]
MFFRMALGYVNKLLSSLPLRKCLDAEPPLHLDPAKVSSEQFDHVGRFRILVIGRSSAGKTSLLQKFCNTTEPPEIIDAKGEKLDMAIVQGSLEREFHSIEDELIFKKNPSFIFHESPGFEAGSDKELNMMVSFMADRATTTKLGQRMHVIWYCISMSDYERPILAAEEKFFNGCNPGSVPVIVVFTKADVMKLPALRQLMDEGMSMKEAKTRAGNVADQIVNELEGKIAKELDKFKYPPKGYLSLASMNQTDADCSPLLRCTANVQGAIELQRLLISTQQVNPVLNIEYAVRRVLLPQFYEEVGYSKEDLEKEIFLWMPLLKHVRYFLLDKLDLSS